MSETNEFEGIEADESVPQSEFSEVPGGPQQDDMISDNVGGAEYDWNKAPETVKGPPRVDLNGQTVVIEKVSLKLPSADTPWDNARTGNSQYKSCQFKLFYGNDGQAEFYSGVRVFKSNDGKYSHPSFMRDRKNQASKLLGVYADYKGKDINEISLKEFLAFLHSKPKAVITGEVFKNPETGEEVTKNIVSSFVDSKPATE